MHTQFKMEMPFCDVSEVFYNCNQYSFGGALQSDSGFCLHFLTHVSTIFVHTVTWTWWLRETSETESRDDCIRKCAVCSHSQSFLPCLENLDKFQHPLCCTWRVLQDCWISTPHSYLPFHTCMYVEVNETWWIPVESDLNTAKIKHSSLNWYLS